MNLNALSVGEYARITAVDEAHPVCQRLMAFGLLPGQVVQVRQIAPLNDPIAIRFEGQQISLRRREAEFVQVEQVSPAAGAVPAA